jgi:cation:H+ antiporter
VLIDVLLLILGLSLLTAGGEMLVRGASALARSLGVSPLVVGLTVVAFGTSAPELAVNVAAALNGQAGISFGNIMGSSIANIGLIVGAAALVRPLQIHQNVIVREIPMMLLASAATLVICMDRALGSGEDGFSQADGAVLLLFFAVFVYYTVQDALRQRGIASREEHPPSTSIPFDLLLVAIGLGGLVLGGQLTVSAAVDIARALGVSEVVIGLTVVAIGTSLPELVTALIATSKGQSDLAMGNVVGSNIFNLLFVLGITALIRPIAMPAGGGFDLLVMIALAVALLPLSFNPGRRIGRPAGVVLLLLYFAYIAWRTFGGHSSQ